MKNMGDLLQDISKRERDNARRTNLVLFLIITAIIVYTTIPTYGVIRDLIGDGETVFSLVSAVPEYKEGRPRVGLMDKIRGFLFPAEKVPVPVLKRIDLKGRVVYSDRTPFVDGLIEIMSEPLYTRTDEEGFFFFHDIEEGIHVVKVLSDSGEVLARCDMDISRHEEVGVPTTLMRLSDGTFVFQVAVRLEVLEITLTLERDSEGNIIGLGEVEIGFTPSEEQPEIVEPTEPEVPSGSSPREEGKFGFRVVDTLTDVQYGRESTDVNIFGDKKRLAPGMKGSYQFTVDNRQNDYAAGYALEFSVTDALPQTNKLPMVYRLKADGIYVAGDDETWVTADKLHQNRTLGAKDYVKYILYWHWPSGKEDEAIGRIVGDEEYPYSLEIRVRAEKR